MTDEELAAALGIECQWSQYMDGPESGNLWWRCDAHIIWGWRDRPEVCPIAAERLTWARKGIEFAKAGIADAIEQKWATEREKVTPRSSEWWLTRGIREGWYVARGWQP